MTAHPDVQLTSIVAWAAHPLAADVGGRVVLLSTARGKYYDLDDVASDLWRRLAHPIRVARLCADMEEEYEGDAGRIEGDVLALLRELLAEGLVELRSDDAVPR